MAILDARELTVRFGGHLAVDGVDLAVEEGAITGLIGPNGAGKTTAFNVITGLQAPTRGTVHLDGVDITALSAHQRARAGIARTFQRLELFGSLSVRDNVRTAAELRAVRGDDPLARTDALLAKVGLADLADQRADAISTGSARLVELARALACRPRVLLLDEPASGLDDHESAAFAATLAGLAAEGLAILIVEHDGEVLAVGTPSEIQRNPDVIDAYLGQDLGTPA